MARKPLLNLPDLSLAGALSPPAVQRAPRQTAASQLETAREVLSVLAKAQPGLAFDAQAASVALRYQHAPIAEAAIVEAAERLAASGDLVLHRGPMLVQLSLALPRTQ